MAGNHHAFSNSEMADMHLMYGLAECNSLEAKRLYEQHFPNRVAPCHKTFSAIHARLSENGSFSRNGYAAGRPRSVRTIQLEENVLNDVTNHPEKSTAELSLQFHTSKHTVWNILKEQQLYPYHIQKVHALLPDDYQRRIMLCQWFIQKCDDDDNFLSKVLFTDEANFSRTGLVNLHNTHIWADENPHAIMCHRHQHQFSLNVWAGILGENLFVSFLPQRLNGERFLNFLTTDLPNLLENVPLLERIDAWFMMDGAPAHYSRNVRHHISNTYGEKWIGRGGPVPWPPRSPDLNPLDFFLWGHLKNIVYSTPVDSVEDLRQRIENGIESIRQMPGVFGRVRQSMTRRLDACLLNRGRNFEQFL